MIAVDTLFFYSFICAAILIYGIGLEKTFFSSRIGPALFMRLPAICFDILLSVALLRYLITFFLIPYDYTYMIPMLVICLCGIIHTTTGFIFPSSQTKNPGELLFFVGTIFLAIYESVTFIDAICIAIASLVSYVLVSIILFSIRERMATSSIQHDWKGLPIMLVSMGLLCIILYSTDISWWVSEVGK